MLEKGKLEKNILVDVAALDCKKFINKIHGTENDLKVTKIGAFKFFVPLIVVWFRSFNFR